MSDWDREWSGDDSYSTLCEHQELTENTSKLKNKFNFRDSKKNTCITCDKHYSRGFNDACREGFYIGFNRDRRSTCDRFRRKV